MYRLLSDSLLFWKEAILASYPFLSILERPILYTLVTVVVKQKIQRRIQDICFSFISIH